MKLGILGGTFDPIHHGHLFIAEEARIRCGLDRVLLVPNAVPPHKQGQRVTTPEHRLAMTRLAADRNPAFECSAVELERHGPSYTLDTLKALIERNPGAELFFITGSDTIPEIPTWHRPDEVIALCHFIAAERPGYSSDLAEQSLPAALIGRVIPLPSVQLEISSTDLRRRVREGLPIRYLTPDSVVEYISEHDLYRVADESG